MKKVLFKSWPYFLIVFAVSLFFWKVIFLGQVPIPGDFMVGTYLPWLDYKWGYKVGVPVKNPVTSDVVSIVYPLRSYAVDIMKSGKLPLWNPNMFNGTPLLADFQVAVFSPTIFLYFILPKISAWTIQIILQPMLAAIFTYLLLRGFKLGKTASLFGGLFYAFAGFGIIWMEWNANTLTAAFIPLIILVLNKFIDTDRMIWLIIESLAICLQILSGYPQLVIYTFIALLILIFIKRRDISLRKFINIALFIFLGILLSGIIIVPGFELFINSQRVSEILEKELIYLPWQNLITFLAPDYFGNPATTNYFGIGNYTLNAGYSGIIVIMLAIVGVISGYKRPEIKYMLTLLAASLVVALPNPFSRFLFNSGIPGISASSNSRILVLTNLSLAVLSAFGIATLFKKEKIRYLWLIIIPTLILIMTAIFTFFWGGHKSISLRNTIFPFVLSSATLLVLMGRQIYIKHQKIKQALILIVCIMALFELFRYGWKYTPFSSPDLVFPNTPVLSYLENAKAPFRVSFGDTIPMNMWVFYGLESVSGYDAVYPIWWARLYRTISDGYADNFNYSYYAPFDLYKDTWFSYLNNTYLLASPSLSKDIGKIGNYEKVFNDKSVSIFKNIKVVPRAFFVSDWEVKPDNEILKALSKRDFPFETKILLSEETNLHPSGTLSGTAIYNLYGANENELIIDVNRDGFLFISDSWYPGWHVWIDNKNEKIYRADYAFKAIPITYGRHIVRLKYQPESFTLGIFLSISASLTLLVIAFLSIENTHTRHLR